MDGHLATPLCLSIRGCHSYCAIHGPSMDGHLATPLCLSICGCHSYCVHPRTIHGWTPCYPPLSKYPWMPELLCHPWTIHGWTPCYPPLSKYLWMPELRCHPWTIHGWTLHGWHTLLPPSVQVSMDGHSNSGIHRYLDRGGGGGRQGGHPWMVHGWHSNSGIHGYLDRGG